MMTAELFISEWNNDSDRLLVHTSGSTGTPKEMWVEKRRMEASARITCNFLGLKEGDTALLCMSPDYIAGKMMIVRSIVCGLRLTTIPPSGHPLATTGYDGFNFAAMVPMQVYNSLQVPEERERLMKIRHLIIGGGAIDDELEKQLRLLPNAIWSTYGMTETLSHIALRRINGEHSTQNSYLKTQNWYTPFDNVSITLNEENCLVIDAPEVCDTQLTTNDIAEIAEDGRRFRILGRKDNVICSGGIKMQIEEIERLLKPHLSIPFMITRRKDPKFGQAVAILLQPTIDDRKQKQDINEQEVRKTCKTFLPKYMCPRHYIIVDKLPMTATGKPARAEAEKIID